MKQYLLFGVFVGAMALGLMVTPASAVLDPCQEYTIEQKECFSGTPTIVREMTFDLFDPCDDALECEFGEHREPGVFYGGVLKSVEVSLMMCIQDGYHHVDNDSEGISWPKVEFGAGAELGNSSGPWITPDVDLEVLNSNTFDDPCLAPDNGDGDTFDPCGPDGATFYGDPCKCDSTGLVSMDLSVPLFYNSWIGPGTFTVDLEADSILRLTQGGSGGVSGQYAPVDVSGCVEIIYTYTCIPEPVTMGLLGVGAVALSRRRRRRA